MQITRIADTKKFKNMKSAGQAWLFFLFLLLRVDNTFGTENNNTELITWNTSLGNITGVKVKLNDQSLYKFMRIPYALPPVGELRFKKPKTYPKWTETLDGTQFGPMCMQQATDENASASEDCLHLNIYVPNNLNVSMNRAVMIWVHGGGFTSGRSSLYDGTALALLGDVIIVTVNYRLNIFGFFSTGDSEVPGNNGLWDQHEAFLWVKNNIQDYGGDPSRMTIFGESAGGDSVGLHSLIPVNKGLFQRVIAESGSGLRKRDFSDKSIGVSFLVAQELGCSSECEQFLSNASVACLRQKSEKDLLHALYTAVTKVKTSTFSFQSPIGPMVDNDLIPGDPVMMLADPKSSSFEMFSSIDYIAGTNTAETGLFYFDLLPYQRKFNFNASLGVPARVTREEIIPSIVRDVYGGCKPVTDELCQKYSPNDGTLYLEEHTDLMSELYLDVIFLNSTIATLDIHSRNSNKSTYQYVFGHVPDAGSVMGRPRWLKGANHADEVKFVFGAFLSPLETLNISKEEKALSVRMMTYWTNFAKTGNPNGKSGQWSRYTIDKKEYIAFNLNDSLPISPLFKERMDFLHRNITLAIESCAKAPTSSSMILNTTLGLIGGTKTESSSGVVYTFKGIPFASPPIGQLRFSKPVPFGRWMGMHDGTKFGNSCIQELYDMDSTDGSRKYSEDCLFLNIYVPTDYAASSKRPVMIWIHGGGFESGSSADVDGSLWALHSDVIIVTINYRLGIFGFFSTADRSLPGNNGLWDQQLAIKWVKENIADYGGDSNMITIFGESSGGVAVGLQALYPPNRGLFKRVIMESVSGFDSINDGRNLKDVCLKLADLSGCPSANSSSENVANCLRNVSAEHLLNIFVNETLKHIGFDGVNLWLRVDDDFIRKKSGILSDYKPDALEFFGELDFMAGSNSAEAVILNEILQPLQKKYNFDINVGIPAQIVRDVMAPSFVHDRFGDCKAATNAIVKMYTPASNNPSDETDLAANFYGDILVHSIVKAVNVHSKVSNKSTYLYLFDHTTPYRNPYFRRPSWLKGALHADELLYLFGIRTFDPKVTNIPLEETELSNRIRDYWTNFAKTGDPTPKGTGNKWPLYTQQKKSYMNICRRDTVQKHMYSKRMDFWSEELPQLVAKCSQHSPTVNSSTRTANSICLIACVAMIFNLVL